MAVDLAPFRSAILAIRWGTLGVGIALAYSEFDRHPVRTVVWATVLALVATYRTVRPIATTETWALLRGLAVDGGIAAAAVMTTGGWESPFTFALLVGPVIAGLARGWLLAVSVCGATVLAVSVVDVRTVHSPVRTSTQWIVELLLVALIAGYARLILGERDEERGRTLTRIGQLADANTLLFSLHRAAQSLPASLDLDEALDTTMSRLRELFAFDVAAVFLHDDTDGRWQVARTEGIRLPERMSTDQLPRGIQRALAVRTSVREDDLHSVGGPGLAPALGSSLSAVLQARGSVIGLVAIEHADANHFTDRDVELLEGFVEPAALAVDNARWFRRLRTVGAEEERNRIARDLHDRTGQSLAYMAFELDRMGKAEQRGEPIGDSLRQLREEVRSVIGEVRETLYDLRTDVSEEQGLLPTLEQFVARLRERSPLIVTVRADAHGRLPVPQERELFRIAQEALVNVERHASADHVTVTWRCDGEAAELLIADDGAGFPLEGAGRTDSYGLVGMRERAEAIGARLEVESAPDHGTFVRCAVLASA